MIINKKLKQSIQQYFLAKDKQTGMFINTKIKNKCIKDINDNRNKKTTGLLILPGVIWLYTKKEVRVFKKNNYWVGKKVKSVGQL